MMSDKLPKPIAYDAVLGRHRLLRSYYDLVCHSAPLFMALGKLARILDQAGQKADAETFAKKALKIDEAIRMGDRIAIMRDGALVQYGTPEAILTATA